jgi:hypothetical protein
VKRNIFTAASFTLVLLCVAGAVYLKWEESQQQEVVEPIPSGYVEPVGYYMNPIKSLSGETYTQTDEEFGLSLELPVEFKQTFNSNSLAPNTIYFEENQQNDSEEYSSRFVLDFQFISKDQEATDKDQYLYEQDVFPRIRNIAVGESYTFSRFSDERKKELFGEEYINDKFTGDHVYTRLPDVNQWKVYQVDYYELEPGSGYKATMQTSTHFLSISYGSQTSPLNPERENILKQNLDMYLSILESARFN